MRHFLHIDRKNVFKFLDIFQVTSYDASRSNSEGAFRIPLFHAVIYIFCPSPCLSPQVLVRVSTDQDNTTGWTQTSFLTVLMLTWCKVTPTVPLHLYYYLEFICGGFIFV